MHPVIIVGSGLAGLACAKRLKEAGLEVLVLEASFHVGGRVRKMNEAEAADIPDGHLPWVRVYCPEKVDSKTKFGTATFDMELGAEFLHGDKISLADICRKQNLKLTPLFTWAHGDGGPDDEFAPDGGFGMYYVGRKDKLMRFDQIDEEHAHMHKVLWSFSELKNSNEYSTKDCNLHDYLSSKGVTETAIAMAEAGYANTAGNSLRKMSLHHTVRCEGGWRSDGDEDARVVGTLYQVIEHLREGIPLKCKQVVNRIDYQDSGKIIVTTEKGAEYIASRVVVSASIPCLQRKTISFSPQFSPAVQRAIDSIQMESACKVILKFSRRSWPEKLHGMVCSDCFVPEIWFEEKDGFYYAIGFATADAARKIPNHSTKETCSLVVAQLSKIFKDDLRNAFLGGLVVDWGAVPYIWGGYACTHMNEDMNARKILSTPIQNQVFFCGEAVNEFQFMTGHGAYDSGIRAASQVLESLHTILQSRL